MSGEVTGLAPSIAMAVVMMVMSMMMMVMPITSEGSIASITSEGSIASSKEEWLRLRSWQSCGQGRKHEASKGQKCNDFHHDVDLKRVDAG